MAYCTGPGYRLLAAPDRRVRFRHAVHGHSDVAVSVQLFRQPRSNDRGTGRSGVSQKEPGSCDVFPFTGVRVVLQKAEICISAIYLAAVPAGSRGLLRHELDSGRGLGQDHNGRWVLHDVGPDRPGRGSERGRGRRVADVGRAHGVLRESVRSRQRALAELRRGCRRGIQIRQEVRHIAGLWRDGELGAEEPGHGSGGRHRHRHRDVEQSAEGRVLRHHERDRAHTGRVLDREHRGRDDLHGLCEEGPGRRRERRLRGRDGQGQGDVGSRHRGLLVPGGGHRRG